MIRLGYAFGAYTNPYGDDRLFDAIAAQVTAAEDAGFDSVWVPDHLMHAPAVAPSDDPHLECYTTLGALAALTSKVRLGSFVACAAYRNPALHAKMVTTLDVISHGRAVFGIGAGWFAAEHTAYGFDMGAPGARYERLAEAVAIAKSMFVNQTTSFHGDHFRAEEALNSPRPIQQGGPPILIGGNGARRTLRLVAEHADICNVLGNADVVRHLMGVLDRHCEAVGRDPSTICRTVTCMAIVRDTAEEAEGAMPAIYRNNPSPLRPIAGTHQQVVTQFRDLLAAGADGLIFTCVQGDGTPDYIALLAELAAEARASL